MDEKKKKNQPQKHERRETPKRNNINFVLFQFRVFVVKNKLQRNYN